ncbi:hypothetical protein R5H32_17300 [Defluviimonas sp. D31]|uniref:ribosome modulation factor n=1 Tax=Defluviimonas sp. D31 TaxID=3083253 RepID=UPI00296F3CDA|nr:hypothetical protein [Defluviimonas sp. D31]MDW4551122.1 hypothetical protein [Defluviimonas sp. D31]
MFQDDFPLLGTPSLLALILHGAEAGPVTLDDCADHLDALFRAANERPALPSDAIRDRLARHIRQLEIARLVEPVGDGAYRLTDRGSETMRHRTGRIDLPDLMSYPEYAAHIRESGARPPAADARGASYDEGYEARRAGRRFTENPYTVNSVDHLCWENGWMEALDDEQP